MKVTRKAVIVALVVAGGIVLAWFLYRESNTANVDAQLAFDLENYLNTVTDSTDWNNYEPLSLEIPD